MKHPIRDRGHRSKTTRVTLGQPIECVECPTVQDSSTMKCCVGHRLSQAPGDGVGDCELCHGLGTAIRSRTDRSRAHFVKWFPGQRASCPRQVPGIPSSGERGVSSRSPIACCGCVGGGFGPWSSTIFQEGGVAPRVIRRNPTIGSGQVTRHVDAWQQVRSTGRRSDSFFARHG